MHVRAMASERATAAGIGQLTVPSSTVGSVPLDNIAQLKAGTAPSNVDRLNRQRQVTIYAGLLPGVSQTPAMDAMTRAAESLGMGAGYSTRFGRRGDSGAPRRTSDRVVLSDGVHVSDSRGAVRILAPSITILHVAALAAPFALRRSSHGAVIEHLLGARIAGAVGVVKKNPSPERSRKSAQGQRMERDIAIVQASRDGFGQFS